MIKKSLIVSLSLLAFAGAAHADQICGKLGSRTVGPDCQTGQACPAYFRVQMTITPDGAGPIDINTGDHAVFESLNSLVNQDACVQETPNPAGYLEVTAVTPS